MQKGLGGLTRPCSKTVTLNPGGHVYPLAVKGAGSSPSSICIVWAVESAPYSRNHLHLTSQYFI